MNNTASVPEDQEVKRYVNNKEILAYAVGLAGQNMTYGYISGWLFYFLENIKGIAPMIVGVITSISRVWDSINDPIIGAMVDKHKFKNGEKLRPILVYAPIPIGILSVLMFAPFNVGAKATIIIITITYLMWDIVYSFQDVALWGMIAVSSPDSDERGKVAQWVSIGAGAGSLLPGLFQTFRDIVRGTGVGDVSIFFIFAIFYGFIGMLISLSAHKMKENVETPKSEESIFEAIFVLRHNKKLLLISAARFCKDVANTILPAVYFFESRQTFNLGFTELPGGTTQVIYSIITGAIGSLAMLFINKLVEKIGGMKRLLVLSQVFNIICRTVCYFIGFKSPAQIFAVMGIMSIANIPINSMDIAHRSLTSDSIDEVEYITGKRTEGISFSMQNFTSKIGSAAVLFINGVVLKALNHKTTDSKGNAIANYQQGELYNKWIWPIFMAGPIIGAILYLIIISFVDDDKDKKLRIEAELAIRRKAIENKQEEVSETVI